MGQAKKRGSLADRIEESTGGVRPLNYTAHALVDLTEMANEHVDSRSLYKLQSVLSLRDVANKLRCGEKFLMPKDALLLDTKGMKESYKDLLRLPYPITVLEFPTTSEKNGLSSKCIVLATTGGDWLDVSDIGSEFEPDQIEEIITFTTIYWSDRQAAWLPTPHLFWFHRDHIVIGGPGGSKTAATGFYWKSLYPSIFKDVFSKFSDEENENEAAHDFQIGMDALVEFCLTVNCENITRVEIPAPAHINKQRVAKGREPFDSYKVLVIPGEHSSDGGGAGTHASPRLHLRRGHLRRLESGRVTWVRHSIVGDASKGLADKVYGVVS